MSDTIRDAKGLMPHIPALWAFLSVDGDGDEGVCGFTTPEGWMPMVAADEKRLASLRQVAKHLTAAGITIRLVKFSQREDIELIEP